MEDVEKIGEDIEKARGKILSSAEKEGDHGLYRFFEDTVGYLGGVHQPRMQSSVRVEGRQRQRFG